jgi:hypothetical protein
MEFDHPVASVIECLASSFSVAITDVRGIVGANGSLKISTGV